MQWASIKDAPWSINILSTSVVVPLRALSPHHALFWSPIASLLPPLHFFLVILSGYTRLASFMMGSHTPWPGLVPVQTSEQTVMDRRCPLSRCMTPHTNHQHPFLSLPPLLLHSWPSYILHALLWSSSTLASYSNLSHICPTHSSHLPLNTPLSLFTHQQQQQCQHSPWLKLCRNVCKRTKQKCILRIRT